MSLSRQFLIELTSGAAAGYDFQIPDVPGKAAAFHDWLELPNGGTLNFIDGDGNAQVLTGAAPGSRYPITVRKIVTCTQTIRLGIASAAGLPGPVGPQGAQAPPATVVGPKVADYTANAGELVLVDTSAGGFTLTLPTAVGIKGQSIPVKDKGGALATHNLTIATTGSQTVDGGAPAALATNKMFRRYTSDGANWMLENSN